MKKRLAVLCAVMIIVSSALGAYAAETGAPALRLGGLKGATSMGMVKLINDSESGLTALPYEFTMAITADELTPRLLKGELDVMAVPANLGSILYNNTQGAVTMLAVSTLGVIYICEKGGDEINSIADLKGRTIYSTGKGTTPEFALTYLLSAHGLNIDSDVTMSWKSEPTETVYAMAASEHAVAMLPQPFVTVAKGQVEGLRVALDLTREWEALDNGSAFITAALIARTDFVRENPETISAFMDEYAASAKWINENVDEGAKLVEKYGIIKEAVAKAAIPYCNIVFIEGEEMAAMASGYFETLFAQKPEAVCGKTPEHEFYYAR